MPESLPGTRGGRNPKDDFLVKFLFLLPLCAVLFCCYRSFRKVSYRGLIYSKSIKNSHNPDYILYLRRIKGPLVSVVEAHYAIMSDTFIIGLNQVARFLILAFLLLQSVPPIRSVFDPLSSSFGIWILLCEAFTTNLFHKGDGHKLNSVSLSSDD